MMQTALDPVTDTITYEYYINQLMVRIVEPIFKLPLPPPFISLVPYVQFTNTDCSVIIFSCKVG